MSCGLEGVTGRMPVSSRPLAALMLVSLAVVCAPGSAAFPEAEVSVAEARLEAVKRTALKHDLKTYIRQLERRWPVGERLDIYLAMEFDAFVVQRVTLKLDRERVAERTLDDREADALMQGGVLRLLRRRHDAASVSLQAVVSGYIAGQEDEMIDLLFEGSVDPAGDVTAAVMTIGERVHRLSSRERGMSFPIAIEHYTPQALPVEVLYFRADVPDAHAHERIASLERAVARYYMAAAGALPAWFLLASMPPEQVAQDAVQHALLLSQVFIQLGMPHAAAGQMALVEGLVPSDQDLASIWRVRLELAALEHARGRSDAALARLHRAPDEIPPEVYPQWAALLGMVLIDAGAAEEAAGILQTVRPRERTPYIRYNLGIALIRQGEHPAGVTQLQRVAQTPPRDAATAALSDRAGLVSAQTRIGQGDIRGARQILRELPLQGPYANAALLSLGWSYLVSEHGLDEEWAGPLRRSTDVSPADFASHRRVTGNGVADSEVRDTVADALPPWRELVRRDVMEPKVQEALVVIPYALQLLGDAVAAGEAYAEAIEALENVLTTIESARTALGEGDGRRMIQTFASTGNATAFGRDWKIGGLPDLPATYWTVLQVSGNSFLEGLRSYRDLVFLEGRLAHSADAAESLALRDELVAMRQVVLVNLVGLIDTELSERHRIAREHLMRARMGRARLLEAGLRG